VVTHQLQVERRTAKAHRPKTNALPLEGEDARLFLSGVTCTVSIPFEGMGECVTNASVCVAGGLVQQRNALIAEIQILKEDHELAVNALNVTHHLTVQSLTDRLETKFSSQLAAG